MKKSLTAISLGVLTALAVVAQEATIPGDSVSTMRNVELDELVVKESLVKHSTKSDTYKVTEAMRRGVDGTMQLLGRLPGVDYNLVTNSISVRNDTKVQILVNGNQVEDSYLKALPPDRIDKVEVTYVPQARFAMAGYKYVIDIKLKHEYRGHDIYQMALSAVIHKDLSWNCRHFHRRIHRKVAKRPQQHDTDTHTDKLQPASNILAQQPIRINNCRIAI